MQQTKRRSKKGVILLALTIAMLVLAFVPAALASPPAQSQLTPDVYMGVGSVYAQGNIDWFYNAPNADYYALMNGTDYLAWTDIPVPALSQGTAGPTLNVGAIGYKVDGIPAGGIAVATGTYPTNIAYSYYTSWSSEGLHTVESMLKETTATVHQLVAKPWVSNVYGIDTTDPDWQHITGIDDNCYYNVDVKFSAIVSDPYGSGVAPTPTAAWDATGATAYQLAWDKWTWEITGTVKAPIPTGVTTQSFYSDTIAFSATDMVGNTADPTQLVKFDVLAPITGYTITPAGADVQTGWTKGPVTVDFKSADPNWPNSSGVAYTEYKVMTSTTTAVPPAPSSGNKGTSVTITATAPIGPTYVYYRSVDSACPAGNKEAWNLVMVFIDNVAPALSDDTPDWWINKFPFLNLMGTAYIEITASDHNSGLAAPGITWNVDGHPGAFGSGMGPVVTVPILPLALGDGIRALTYSATDKAGNKAEGSNQIKIDTRGPVTDGDAGWINGLAPYMLTATDQAPGSGVAATVYRVDQATPWSINAAATVAPTLETSVNITPLGGTPVQGSVHTVDFASVDAALPFWFDAAMWAASTDAPSWHLGNWELDILNILKTGAAYNSRSVKLDIVAPEVTAMDPKNGNWQKGPAVVNFSGTDVGSGYSHTEWSTDGGTTWTSGEVASVGGDGEITVTYHGVDKVGLMSADQTIMVMVASTPPTVTGGNVSVKKGKKATFHFNVTSVTPTAQVIIQIRTKSGRTVSTHHYANVTTGMDMTRSFKVNIKKGKYNIRIGAVDQAGNVQTRRGGGTLTVK